MKKNISFLNLLDKDGFDLVLIPTIIISSTDNKKFSLSICFLFFVIKYSTY